MGTLARILIVLLTVHCLLLLHIECKQRKNKNSGTETNFDQEVKPGQLTCQICGKSFKTQKSLQQHIRDKGHELSDSRNSENNLPKKPVQNIEPKRAKLQKTETNFDQEVKPGQFTCQTCGRSFKTQKSLQQHIRDKGHELSDSQKSENNLPKEPVQNIEPKRAKLQRSNSIDRDDRVDSTKERRRSISEMEKDEIAIDKNEKKNANAEYSYVMKKIINHVRTYSKGDIYSADIHLAGSNLVKTKVGSADEVDTNIKLKIDVEDILTDTTLTYIYEDKNTFDDKRSVPREMTPDRKFRDIPETSIPHGQAVVKVKNPSLLYNLTYKDDLIPHKVLQDLHSKVGKAIEDLNFSHVKLSPTAQGPALTITIKQEKYSDINVDIVPSLPCSLPVDIHGWPRKDSRSAFKKKVEAVKKAGLHLVPKGDETWTISYSKAEKALLDGIDDNNEYRRGAMKLLKQFLQNCKEDSPSKLPGLSSYIVKIQILWSSERRRSPGYWSAKYKDRILLDVIDDMVESLESGILPEYFDVKINILATKSKSELHHFAECLKKEKKKIEMKQKDELYICVVFFYSSMVHVVE
ncbi:uncharacterized protein LOC132747111 [Ruditapes philippinarum]|uniref:uncharacterized protein LOC132747111 n=1 Tax=Ruditapes philippinarum TaxID=129788 RepID=UPI00295AEF9D|nr:uncharacterized protein LOC132747111 [Ruditapes philippinarum]